MDFRFFVTGEGGGGDAYHKCASESLKILVSLFQNHWPQFAFNVFYDKVAEIGLRILKIRLQVCSMRAIMPLNLIFLSFAVLKTNNGRLKRFGNFYFRE